MTHVYMYGIWHGSPSVAYWPYSSMLAAMWYNWSVSKHTGMLPISVHICTLLVCYVSLVLVRLYLVPFQHILCVLYKWLTWPQMISMSTWGKMLWLWPNCHYLTNLCFMKRLTFCLSIHGIYFRFHNKMYNVVFLMELLLFLWYSIL